MVRLLAAGAALVLLAAGGAFAAGPVTPAARSAPPEPDLPVDLSQLPPAAPVIVDLTALSAGEAERLAGVVPEYDEAINAGTEQLKLTLGRVRDLQAAGFAVRATAPAQNPPPGWQPCYHRLAQIYAWIADNVAAHPDLLEVIDIGDSFCKSRGRCTSPNDDRVGGRDLLVVRVTNEAATSPKQGRLWIDGGIHARELPTPELMMAFISHVLDGYGRNPQITYLLDHRELYVLVVTNPDGREMVELGTREPYDGSPWYWRKNVNGTRRADECPWPPEIQSHYGVDLNRNFEFQWDSPGHSANPCAETYYGTGPGSEPETQAYEAFVRSIFPDQRGALDSDPAQLDTTGLLISFHNFTSQGTMLVPWGWSESPAPNDAQLVAIAERFTAPAAYNWQYGLYLTSGGARDWAYGELGIPAYVVELSGMDFFTPCQFVPEILASQLGPLEMALGISDRPYERIQGPETVAVDALPTVAAGDPLLITAQLDESRAGNDAIVAAEVMIGRRGGPAGGESQPHPGVPPGAGMAMAAVDGRFDTALELTQLSLDTTGLTAGWHYIAVRGRDERDHWGPIATLPLEVTAPEPVLTVTASAPTAVTAGDVLTYSLTVTVARAAAPDVTLSAQVPNDTTFRAASAGGREAAGTVSWDLGDLPTGTAPNVILTVDVAPSALERTITFAGYTARHVAGGEVSGPPLLTHVFPPPLLSVTKAGPARATAGDILTYTLTVGVSQGPARGVVVTDYLPPGTAFVAASAGASLDDELVTWSLGDLDRGTIVSLVLSVRTAAAPVEEWVVNSDFGARHARGSGERGPAVVTRVGPVSTVWLPIAAR